MGRGRCSGRGWHVGGALERSLWLGWEVRVQEGDEYRIRVLRAPRSQMKGRDDLEQWREVGLMHEALHHSLLHSE